MKVFVLLQCVDEAEKIPDEIYSFMCEGLDNHESVLVKSERA